MSDRKRPNIVMILTDDHASRAISAYGSEINSTPRIDEIFQNGWRFDRCLVANALCSPSRASILTGTHSHINGVSTLVTPLDASQPTFISQLRSSGYRTAMVGKWHMGHDEGNTPEGFDYWDIFVGSDGQGEYWNPLLLSEEGERIEEGYATDIVTDLALRWLDTVDPDQPWCVLIYHKAPHRPWQPKPEHAELFRDAVPLPSTFSDDYESRSSSVRRALMRIADSLNMDDLKQAPPAGLSYDEMAVWKYQRLMEDYLACVHSVDENVGRVIDWLRERQQFDDTLVMYASDQGFFLGEHGWFDKRLMYEDSLIMPMLLSYPATIPGGQVHSGLVSNVDFAQSILEAAGVEPHPRMQGRSFWGDLTGEEAAAPAEGLYYRYWEHDDTFHHAPAHYGYRTDRHKIIYYYNDGMGIPGTGPFVYPPEWELYDLHEDPEELTNVYDHPAYSTIREELKAVMWLEQRRLKDEPHPSQPIPELLSGGISELSRR